MRMNKQIKLYSISLGMAKTDEEKWYYRMKYINESSMYKIKKQISDKIKEEPGYKEWTQECQERFKEELSNNVLFNELDRSNRELTIIIHDILNKFKGIREINSKDFKKKNIIALFDNVVTRTLGLKKDELTKYFMVIEVGNTDMTICKQVIINGVIIDGIKYKFFTAGAGQTRKKKFMIIREDLWNKHEKEFMCGLTINKINEMGGMNINKFNAYLSLNNSASDIIEGFNIDECIVVDDFTEKVDDVVDYIKRDDDVDDGEITYVTKDNKTVTRKKKRVDWTIEENKRMIVPIDFMDGAGICLPSVFKKNTQVRLPWVKGLICPVNFIKYAKEEAHNTKVIDLWGKEYDLIEDNIKVIFTKSQFKMWKYYKDEIDMETGEILKTGWEVYKECFKKYHCTANKCMEDEDKLKNMRINYQMLQTLNKMTDEDIGKLTNDLKETINEVHYNKKAQLEFLGATVNNNHRNYFQECLRIYPEMLTSKYVKKQISDTITSLKNEAKSGRIKLNAKRTFIIPDLVHFMSVLLDDGSNYALKRGEVYFNVYKDDEELALLRSPHLSREWAIRKNAAKISNNRFLKYFKTNGVYVSADDLMSLILMFDVDGDEALVVSNKEDYLINLAKRQMKGLNPLYYEMGKASAKEINLKNEFESLRFVYEKSNIGKVSNTLTNIWSRDDCEDYKDEIKKLCAYNNWIIDSAKTLELPKLPKNIKELMDNKTYPYFFHFAKKKKFNECREIGNGVIDRICKDIDSIEKKRFYYGKEFGKFDLNKLLHDNKIICNKELIEYFNVLEKNTIKRIKFYATKYQDDCDFNFKELCYSDARKEFLEYCKDNDIEYLTAIDIVVRSGFEKDKMKLTFIFNTFGAAIFNNLTENLKNRSLDNGWKMCEVCGNRFKLNSKYSNAIYCKKCSDKIEKEKHNLRQKKYKNKK